MDTATFESRLRALLSSFQRGEQNTGCVACERCRGCTSCMFCVGCERVRSSQYCTDSADCIDCSHCHACTGCVSCSHSVACDGCAQSAYLVRSTQCHGCTYCFGCVGLTGRDFHILNEPYDRQTYFTLVGKLTTSLRIPPPP